MRKKRARDKHEYLRQLTGEEVPNYTFLDYKKELNAIPDAHSDDVRLMNRAARDPSLVKKAMKVVAARARKVRKVVRNRYCFLEPVETGTRVCRIYYWRNGKPVTYRGRRGL